jgi:DnaJ-class molecular chaperone
MTTPNWYEILGVDRSVTNKDLTKQYQRLARLHHPDLNGGTKEAEARFKLITQGYAILSDAEERRKFDLGTPQADTQSGNQQTNKNASPPPPKSRGRDYVVAEVLHISLGESLTGCTKIHVVRQMSGLPKKLKIAIPAGAGNMKARVAGLGYPSSVAGGRPGDLLVPIQVKLHPVYRRVDSDLLMTLRISPIEALLGTSIEFKDLYGKLLVVKIVPQTKNNSILTLKGSGVATFKDSTPGPRGNMRVKIKVVPIPKNSTIDPSVLSDLNTKLYGREIRSELLSK